MVKALPYSIPLKDYISLAAFLLVVLENDQHVEITLCPKLKKISQRDSESPFSFENLRRLNGIL